MAKKILVIDDDALVLRTLNRYLKSCGYEVEIAGGCEDAVKKVETSLFSLIIADVRMPGINGIETLKMLRKICEDKHKVKVPEIIITGFASEDAQKEAKEMGVAEYIYKPFEVSVFIDAVKRCLGE